jgi:lipopolysaccharide export system permease protein
MRCTLQSGAAPALPRAIRITGPRLKIISRYVIREHIGPFTFALIALTSLMLLNFISRQFGELVGKGLPWGVIGQFFVLSIPFTLALTVPMSVLVAVLYAFSRLASENEVTAMKANGVSPWRLVAPAIVCGVLMSAALLAFNDQVLPSANHELKTLQDDISQTKPTFFLKEQVINPVAEGKFYLKADKVDQASGRMKQVVIYDLADPLHRRTIYAESGRIAFRANRVDLDLTLYSGEMQEVSSDKPTQINRLFFASNRIRVPNVGSGGGIKRTKSDSSNKGDREMSVCEMQQRLWRAQTQYELDLRDLEDAKHPPKPTMHARKRTLPQEPGGLGAIYCGMLKAIGLREAHAAEVDPSQLHAVTAFGDVAQDTVSKKAAVTPAETTGTVRRVSPRDSAPSIAALRAQQARAHAAGVKGGPAARDTNLARFEREQMAARVAAQAAAAASASAAASAQKAIAAEGDSRGNASAVTEAKLRLEISQRARDRYVIEINKKFSLAAACLIFAILAPPIALRFPRGGVGLVIGVSLLVFALYYVGLIGGEAAANNGYVPPFWAMWGTNVIMTAVGIVMLLRMGKDRGSARGGGLREWLDERRFLREEKRAAAANRVRA